MEYIINILIVGLLMIIAIIINLRSSQISDRLEAIEEDLNPEDDQYSYRDGATGFIKANLENVNVVCKISGFYIIKRSGDDFETIIDEDLIQVDNP